MNSDHNCMINGVGDSVELMIRQVGHWGRPRWAAAASTGDTSRADLVHGLVQRLADLVADVEGEPRRAVPVLENPLVLPDQLRVVAADLLAADPPQPVLDTAVADITATRAAL